MEQLTARGWKLVAIGGTGVESSLADNVEVTLAFTPDGRVAGSGGCNRYFAAVEFGEPGELSMGPVGSTMMACPQLIMAQEQLYLKALQVVETYRLDGNRLELLFGVDGVLTFEATELPES
jgi:heat shock protein HslJ